MEFKSLSKEFKSLRAHLFKSLPSIQISRLEVVCHNCGMVTPLIKPWYKCVFCNADLMEVFEDV